MPQRLFLLLALTLTLAGCTVFRKSPTWEAVMRTRPRVAEAADPSATYADHLHRQLAARGVEHRIVTYEFGYFTRQHEEAIGSRTAVIYRDDTHPVHPWWLTDERQSRPRWLPNGSVEKQVSFFARGDVKIVQQRHYPARRDGRSAAAVPPRAVAFRAATAAPLRAFAADPDLRALFRTRHGTGYDPASALDRGKMIALRHTVALR
jgi:hypothetical protein